MVKLFWNMCAASWAPPSSPERWSSPTILAVTRWRASGKLIEACGATLLFLPPYSPDFNPIENFFAKLKARFRQAAQRTFEGLLQSIATILDSLTAQECRNYFQAAGYVNS